MNDDIKFERDWFFRDFADWDKDKNCHSCNWPADTIMLGIPICRRCIKRLIIASTEFLWEELGKAWTELYK